MEVSNWLNNNVNPVGSAVIVDKSFSIEGAASDSFVTGDILYDLNTFLDNENKKYINLINLYNENDLDFMANHGFSGTTGNIVSNSGTNVTGFIPIKKNDTINAFYKTGNILTKEGITVSSKQKIAFYDRNKNWIKTIDLTLNPYESAPVSLNFSGYVRLQTIRSLGFVRIFINSIGFNVHGQPYNISKIINFVDKTSDFNYVNFSL